MTTGTTSLSSTSPATLNCNDFTARPSSPFHTTASLADYTSAMMVAIPGAAFGCASFLPGFYCLQESRRRRGDHIAVRSGIVGSS